ncbi:MAG: hypothetical protein JRE23_13650 [Deltaproteobacteria bacterium]|nr:hypothetical protein [Deltaproteobacteria bacterium]
MAFKKATQIMTGIISDFIGTSKQAAGEISELASKVKETTAIKDVADPLQSVGDQLTASERNPQEFSKIVEKLDKRGVTPAVNLISDKTKAQYEKVNQDIARIIDYDSLENASSDIAGMRDVTGILEQKGLAPEVIEDFIKTKDVKVFRNNIQNKLKENIIAEELDISQKQAGISMNQQSIDRIMGKKFSKDPLNDSMIKISKFKNSLEAGRQLLHQEMSSSKWSSKIFGLSDMTMNISSLASSVQQRLHKFGANTGARAISQYVRMMKHASNLSAVQRSVLGDLSQKLNAMAPDKKLAWTKYYEGRDVSRFQRVPIDSKMTSRAIDVDVDLLKSSDEFKLLTQQDLELVNQATNVMRSLAKQRSNIKRGVFDMTGVASKLDDYDVNFIGKEASDKIQYDLRQTYGGGDFSPTYLPVVPTKAHFDSKMASDGNIVLDEYKDTSYRINYDLNEYRKRGGSELSKNHASRLPVDEAIKEYARGFDSMVLKKHGNQLLADAGAIMGMELNARRGASGLDMPSDKHAFDSVLRPLIDAHNSKFNVARKPMEEWNALDKSVNLLSSTMAALLLNNPKMWPFNAIQFLTNGSGFRGFKASGYGLLKQVPFVKDVIANKGSVEKAYRDLANKTDNPIASARIKRFYRENTSIHTPTMEEFIPTDESQSAWRFIINASTVLFRTSDQLSRYGSFASASKAVDDAVVKFQKSMRGINPKSKAQAIKEIYKDLHMDQFDYTDRLDLVNLLAKSDEAGVLNEFGYQYVKNAVTADNYDYSKLGTTLFADKIKNFSPAVGTTAMFTSWSFHYMNNVIGGAIRAYKNGDKKPMASLALMSMAWGAAAAAVTDSENETLESIGKYALTRTPVIQPITSLISMTTQGPARTMESLVALPMWASYKAQEEMIGFITDKKTGLTYKADEAYNKMAGNPFIRSHAGQFLLDVIDGE